MNIKICFTLALIAPLPALSQVQPSTTELPTVDYANNDQMVIPAPLTGNFYPTVVGAEERSNYLSFGLGVDISYDDNVLTGTMGAPMSDTTYSFLPSIAYDRSTPRQEQNFVYSPGFTIFNPTSQLDAVNQNATAAYEYRISPYVKVDLSDLFVQTSNLFGPSYSSTAGGVSGAPTSSTTAVIVPYAALISNTVKGIVSYQFELNDMVGASGTFGILDFPDATETPGLYNAHTEGGSGFYSHRISNRDYIGAAYDYQRVVAFPPNAQSAAEIQDVVPFFAMYFGPHFSVSLTGGPQYYRVTQTNIQTTSAWGPVATGSIGWQRSRTNIAANYTRSVTAGGGLLGAYNSNSAGLSARWQVTHAWLVACSGNYAVIKNVTPLIATNPGGHSISGTAFVERSLGEKIDLEFGYSRLHESYSQIAFIRANPDSDRVYGSLTYRFRKSLGR